MQVRSFCSKAFRVVFLKSKLDIFLFAAGCFLVLGLGGGGSVFAQQAQSPLVITEFLASNTSGLQDENGDYSDWIEIHNRSAAAVNLNGWYLTDDAGDPVQWAFPSMSLDSGAYLLVYASGKDRRDPAANLHTNFQISANGGYLALVGPGPVVLHEFNPYPRQSNDMSYGLYSLNVTLVKVGAEAAYKVPTAADASLNWKAIGFDQTSWDKSPTSLGFGAATVTGMVSQWLLDENSGTTAIDFIGGNNASLNGSAAWAPTEGQVDGAVRLNGTGSYLSVGNESNFDFTNAMTVACWIKPDTFDATWQAFVCKGDYSWRLHRSGDTNSINFACNGLSQLDVAGTTNVNDGQWHHVVGIYDGANLYVYVDGNLDGSIASTGQIANTNDPVHIGSNASMSGREFKGLIDDVCIFNRALTAEEIGTLYTSTATRTDLRAKMLGINSTLWTRLTFTGQDLAPFDRMTLSMKYEDGFAAFLNGAPLVSSNAPAPLAWNSTALTDRPDESARLFQEFDVTSAMSQILSGTNVLAIQTLNDTANDDSFTLLPELRASSAEDAAQYFTSPSPGEANTASGLIGLVGDIKFSQKRGFYTTAFNLTVTCDTPGVEIRYTTNGNTPTKATGTLYTGPISISKTTPLRVVAFKEGWKESKCDTQTYLFLADVIRQSPNGELPGAGWPNSGVNWQTMDYGMDPDVVNNATYSAQMIPALQAIPTFSIVTDLNNLFSASSGIYVNASGDGAEWERPASFELINPDGTKGFQINGGLRIRGGYSRSGDNPKHAFRLFFRSEYGESKLRYPLFGEEGANEFDKVDLRTAQNYSWSFGGDSNNTMVREIWSRDTQRDMGDPYTRGRYYHLYIDGQYWGVYDTQERAESNFAATYMGDSPSDYDVFKVDTNGYVIYATDGSMANWQAIWNLANAGFNDTNYYRVLGCNPDRSRNPAYPILLDQDNLIQYMLIIYYTGNFDAPISAFLGNESPNNFYGILNRKNPTGWKFFAHDAEHTLFSGGWGDDRTGPWPAGNSFEKSNPQWLNQKLLANLEYKTRFGDLVHRHFFNNGLLTPAKCKARLQERANQIDKAIIAESARWGDSKSGTPLTRNAHWLPAVNWILNQYFPTRTDIVLNQFKAKGWYPSVEAPVFSQHGGKVPRGYELSMTTGGGTSTPKQVMLLARGSAWRYLDDGSDQGTAWQAEAFNDSTWPSGNAHFGYGDDDEVTTLNYGPDPNNKYITYYFRTPITVTDAAKCQSLVFRICYDDGAVVYLNGQKLQTINFPEGTVDINYLTQTVNGTPGETTFYEYAVDPSLLKEGQNVLAVEIHQMSAGSSDVSFDFELEGTWLDDSQTNGKPVYYTINSTDPRLPGGAINTANAQLYSGATPINYTKVIKARTYDNGQWSALNEALFLVNDPATSLTLTLSEVNYNPATPTATELAALPTVVKDDFEFIELTNISATSIDLAGVQFTQGITYVFNSDPLNTSILSLDPGARCLLVRNKAAFERRYGTGLPIAGVYQGSLSNSGETLKALDAAGHVLALFEYKDGGSWPGRPDGNGSSLELVNQTGLPTPGYTDPDAWRASVELYGSPGRAGMEPRHNVVINEVLSHTDPPQSDSIELFNTSATQVSIAGWYLSDSSGNFFKFAIPVGVLLDKGGYITYNESNFNPTPLTPGPNDFGLNGAHGDDVYLMAPTKRGGWYFADHVDFGAMKNGESFGRWPNGTGKLYPMLHNSWNSANPGPRVGPLVISEIHYNPGTMTNAGELEFVEIHNPTGVAVDLTGWMLHNGVEFSFTTATLIEAGGYLAVLSFDPANSSNAALLTNFKSTFGIDDTARLTGPYSGSLSNGGEKVQLMRPDEPPTEEPWYTPSLIEDEVDYDNQAPWPLAADGTGKSLTRNGATLWGNDPASWQAATPTPGVNPTSGAPKITSVPNKEAMANKLYQYTLTATGSPVPTLTVEGLPNWLLFNGTNTISGTIPGMAVGFSYTITITATNTRGQDVQQYTLLIVPYRAPEKSVWKIF
jgi:hypothetical protein